MFSIAGKPVTVVYPYDGKLRDELAMKPGDVITVDDWNVSDDWARGTLNGKTGLFYKAFTKPSSEVPSPADFKLKEVRGKPKGYEATYQGREYILKEKLDEVECIICHELADNVHQTSCCGNTVCLRCAGRWKKRNDSCPQCRKAPLEIVVDPKTQRRITGAAVYCPNYQFGCDWVDSFGRVAEHLKTDCECEGEKCQNSECKEVLPRKFLKIHKSNLCLWRGEACPCCRIIKKHASNTADEPLPNFFSILRKVFAPSLTYHDIITAHCHGCSEWPIRCPNSCKPYLTLTRSSVSRHMKDTCPESVIDCKFAEVGCKVKVKRKDMAQHMQEALSDHVTALFTDYMELKSNLAKVKHENAQLKEMLRQRSHK